LLKNGKIWVFGKFFDEINILTNQKWHFWWQNALEPKYTGCSKKVAPKDFHRFFSNRLEF